MTKKQRPEAELELQTVEILRAEKNTPDWLFAAARVYAGWAVGQEVTPAEYDRIIDETGKVRIG